MYSAEKILYFKHKLISKRSFVDKNINIIKIYAKNNKIEFEELYGILLIEHFNRGNIFIKILENLLVKYFSRYVIKKDFSLGLAQIKISTACKYYPDMDKKEVLQGLMRDEFSIKTCALIISDYNKILNQKNRLLGLVKGYTTGDIKSKENNSIITYYLLLHWIKHEMMKI